MAAMLWKYRWWPIAIYWIVIYISTHTPLPPDFIPEGTDKVAHFLIYGLLAFQLAIAIFSTRPVILACLAGGLLLYGIFDEVTQLLVNRHCSFDDWVADAVGIILGVTCGAVAVNLWRHRAESADSAKSAVQSP